MAKYTAVDERVESKSEKRVRIFLAVLFSVVLTLITVPLYKHVSPLLKQEGAARRKEA